MRRVKRKSWRRAAAVLLSGAALCLLAACADSRRETEKSIFAMDTYMTFIVYGRDGEENLEAAAGRVKELEALWSVTREDSDLYAVNHSQGGAVAVAPETASLIRFALEMAEETDGALEPTLYPVLSAWGFTTGEYRIPSEAELESLLRLVDHRRVCVTLPEDAGGAEAEAAEEVFPDAADGAGSADMVDADGAAAFGEDAGDEYPGIVTLEEGMMLDLGAVGKGYAGDLIVGMLRERNVESALLDMGGNIQTIGSRPDGGDWHIGIQDPFGEGIIGIVSVSDLAVVTSGDYERFFLGEDGERYGHILDPATGRPAQSGLASVTVLAGEGKRADALSTALYVMGPEKAREYWLAHRDFEMILVTEDGEICLTEGAAAGFTPDGRYDGKEIIFHIAS